MMKYPEWAPQRLVELHMRRTDNESSVDEINSHDPETIIADLAQRRGGNITEEKTERIRRSLYRKSLGLPDKESTALLGQLITDDRMKGVWKSLIKRFKDDRESLHFFSACEGGKTGWRGNQKQTAAQRKAFYQEIHDTAGRLQSLMHEASEFDFYSPIELVDDHRIEWLLEEYDASFPDIVVDNDKNSYARFCLHEIMPSTFEIFRDISKKATQYGEEESPVKKPNSQNAEIHYFIRLLSGYLQQRYNQPLHEVVASTTTVIFNQENIDDDYVRKIVKK